MSRRVRQGRAWRQRLLLGTVAVVGAGLLSGGCDEGAGCSGGGSHSPSRGAGRGGPAETSSAPGGAVQGSEPSGALRDTAQAAEIDRLLMPMDEYQRRARGAPGMVVLRVGCPERSLVYVGFQHSIDPTDPAFSSLEAHWQRYQHDSTGARRTVLVEGRVREVASTRDAAIREAGGEGGLVTFLARRDAVDSLESPEPEPDAVAARLAGTFSRDAICYAYFARSVALWNAQGAPPPLDSFVAALPLPRATGCDYSLRAMEPVHERLFGPPLDPAAADFFRRTTDPARLDTVVGRVLRADTRARDVHIVGEIARRFVPGTRLFVVYGTAHVLMQEPALRTLLCRGCAPAACAVEVATEPRTARATSSTAPPPSRANGPNPNTANGHPLNTPKGHDPSSLDASSP